MLRSLLTLSWTTIVINSAVTLRFPQWFLVTAILIDDIVKSVTGELLKEIFPEQYIEKKRTNTSRNVFELLTVKSSQEKLAQRLLYCRVYGESTRYPLINIGKVKLYKLT